MPQNIDTLKKELGRRKARVKTMAWVILALSLIFPLLNTFMSSVLLVPLLGTAGAGVYSGILFWIMLLLWGTAILVLAMAIVDDVRLAAYKQKHPELYLEEWREEWNRKREEWRRG